MTNFASQGSANDDAGKIINEHPPNMLFIIGEKDRVNPPELALRVRDALIDGHGGGTNDSSATTIETLFHPAGHAVPVSNTDTSNAMTEWVLRVADGANQE